MAEPMTFEQYDYEREKILTRSPKCEICGEHIQTEYCCDLPKYGYVCEDCIRECWVLTEDVDG